MIATRLVHHAHKAATGRKRLRASGPSLPSKIGDRCREQGRSVQRFRADAVPYRFCSELAKADVDVVKNLDVVAQESNRLTRLAHGLIAQRSQRVFDCRADPWAAGHALALKGKKPVVMCQTIDALRPQSPPCALLPPDKDRARSSWRAAAGGCVWIVLQGTLCAVNSTGTGAPIRAEGFPHRTQPLGKGVGEERMICPALHEVDLIPQLRRRRLGDRVPRWCGSSAARDRLRQPWMPSSRILPTTSAMYGFQLRMPT